MDALRQDLRYAVRRLVRSPAFTVVAVASLALGIGANTAIFSLVNAVLLRELPLERPEELVDVYMAVPDFSHAPLSFPEYEDVVRETEDVFSGVATSRLGLVQVDVDEGVEAIPVELVTGNYFPVLGVDAEVGRTLTPEDHVAQGAHPVVVLGWGYWQRIYGGDPAAVGREVRIAGRPYTVVGVAPQAYTGQLRGLQPDLYLPALMANQVNPDDTDELAARGNHSWFVKARLRPGVTMPAARASLDRVMAGFRSRFPERYQGEMAFTLVPTQEVVVNPAFDRVLVPALATLLLVVGLVLLVACANLASFLLARAADRRREIAMRIALGARRAALVRQLLVETMLLALLGGVAGIGVAAWLLRALLAADLPLPLPVTLDLSLDTTVLGYTLLVSVAAGLFFGLLPAVQATNPDVAPVLKDGGGDGGRPRRLTLRNALVVGQVALSLVLLTGAGLTLRSMAARQAVDPGFGEEPTAIVALALPVDRYPTQVEQEQLFRDVEARARAVAGVEAVGLIGNVHLNTLSNQSMDVVAEGVEPPPGTDHHTVDWSRADPGFFDAAGVEIVQGRGFTAADDADAPPVVVINRTFAERFFPGRDPVGGTVTITRERVPATVVGVAEDVKIRTLGEAPRAFLYRPYAQDWDSYGYLLARTGGDARRAVIDLVQAVRALEPGIIVFESKTMERHLAALLLPARLGAVVGVAFAVLALALAMIGLYGVVSYAVARRTREVGIRLSLGAEPRRVVGGLMRRGMTLVGTGAALGLVLSALFAQALGRFLYGIPSLDPVTFVAVPALLVAVGAVASWVPARRATRVDPVRALRAD